MSNKLEIDLEEYHSDRFSYICKKSDRSEEEMASLIIEDFVEDIFKE
ncbi:hypothetical protein [Halopenitus sp. POP-27]|nr:hypothetical protein [Halopenitus sp. POP-27]